MDQKNLIGDKMEKHEAIIKVLGENGIELTDKEKNAIKGAFCTKGAYKGYLYKSKPNVNKKPLESAAWLALQPNPYKIGMAALMMLSDEEKALFDKLSRLPNGQSIKYPSFLDKDREALEKMGVW